MSFPTTIVIANAKPSIVIQSLEGISIDSQGLLRVESQPSVISVNYLAVNGRDGADGAMPDFAEPGTVAAMIAALSGEITSSQLHSDLLRSIEKIDVGPTSLEAQASLLAYADSLLNASIAEDSARIDANEAAVVVLDGRLDTFGVDLSTLDGTVTANSAAIDSIETRVVATESDIYTQAQTVQGISSRIDVAESNLTAQAAIVNQNTTAITEIDGDITSVAETISTITAGVGGMSAAIQIQNQVIAGTTTPLYAQHTVKLDVNGKISGFGLSSTNNSSLFEILADRFAVTNGLNSGIIPFIVDGANVYIQNGFIQNAAIDTAKIADAAITVAKIEDATITAAKIADATITAAKIANATITDAQIALATITNALITDATITGAKIASATIEAANIKDATITTAKIADAQITSAKIANATITTADIANAQITTALIADANITNAKIGDAQVTTLKIGGNAVTLPAGGSLATKLTGTNYWQNLVSITITAVGQPVSMSACVQLQCRSLSSTGYYALRLRCGAVSILTTGTCYFSGGAPGGYGVANISGYYTPSAGSQTFTVEGLGVIAVPETDFPAGTSLLVTELRR